MELFYRLNNRHLEGIRHPRSPATCEMLLQTTGEPRSIQNGCISFRPLWLVLSARRHFKGAALEAQIHGGKSVLPTGELRGSDNTRRQIDAAFGFDDILVICECRAVARSIAVERGSPHALAKRKDVIDKALTDIDEKAQWLVAHPKGTNYDISDYKQILPIGVTPFKEFIPSRDSRYWLSATLPRVLSPPELQALLGSKSLKTVANACSNCVRH